ncbi:Hypothetical predicted protein [Paramuricea clavata]|uniref:Helitron helicase-like domain-containing protein n=1 Tax=Paramuricea clavata TaxID=317549 RepID=A0A6S7GVG2_PARCT|nr:Hypothetical predicted protein [Paramuricea clavata]
MTWQKKSELIQKDPVTCARNFEHMVQQFIHNFIKSSCHPIGEVVDFFYRVEFQQRGSPHIHGLFWTKNAPEYGKDFDEDITNFVDSYVSCKADSDDLTELVNLQRHKHSKTCKKRGNAVCRFNFPLPPMPRTMILEPLSETDLDENVADIVKKALGQIRSLLASIKADETMTFDEFLKKLDLSEQQYLKAIRLSLKHNTLLLKRSPAEIRINCYNPNLLRTWKANMDIQYVLDPYACAVYILSYITKGQRGMSKLLRKACEEAKEGNKNIVNKVRHIGNKFLNAVEISAQEAVYLVMQMPLRRSSREFQFINTSDPHERTFLLKSMDKIKELPDHSVDIESDNIIKRYQRRPKKLENLCLADFVAWFNCKSDSNQKIKDIRLDVQTTIANRLNEYCRNNSGNSICSANRTFTKDDVLVQIDPATSSVSFVVLDPQTRLPVSASGVQDAISGEFMSDLLDLEFTVPLPQENIDNAINVVLKNFQADQWSLRDTLFRQNMAEEIRAFCNMSTYHRDICNISDADVNGFTSDHIRRLPNSPTQNGTDSILSFYAVLPSGSGSLPSSVLATIFTSQQDNILSVNSELENPGESISSSQTPALTPTQTQNIVAITIFNFKSAKVNTLVVVDIRVTVAARMNIFCFSTPGDVCSLIVIGRRKKRSSDQFSQNDVIVDGSSVMDAGTNTVVGVVVNQPGTVTPVESSVVEDALHQTIQEDGQTQITNLTLAVVNAPTVSNNQRDNAISVRLTGIQPSEWTLQQDISFRNNMSDAIVQFCNQSDARLASCNLTRDQLNEIDFQNIQILPNSPTQDGDNSVLSFFVNLPSGATMPQIF